jgi:hypothetical protein
MKTCPNCGLPKEFSEFNRNSGARDGLQAWCRECNRERSKQWRRSNPEVAAMNQELMGLQKAEALISRWADPSNAERDVLEDLIARAISTLKATIDRTPRA